jgi:hypothetical protein
VIFESPPPSLDEFERRTGWKFTPQGACKGSRCVPLDRFDVRSFAEKLGMPIVEAAGAWALGPETGRALATAEAPDLRLPDWRGAEFQLASLRGRKVLLVAWASW